MRTGKILDWHDMDETAYRASQICRILGNPKAFRMLLEIRRLGTATPTELALLVDRSVPTVSLTLKSLRQAQLVRYQRDGSTALYRLKSPRVAGALHEMESLAAHLMRPGRRKVPRRP